MQIVDRNYLGSSLYVASQKVLMYFLIFRFTYAARTHSDKVRGFMSSETFSHNQMGNS